MAYFMNDSLSSASSSMGMGAVCSSVVDRSRVVARAPRRTARRAAKGRRAAAGAARTGARRPGETRARVKRSIATMATRCGRIRGLGGARRRRRERVEEEPAPRALATATSTRQAKQSNIDINRAQHICAGLQNNTQVNGSPTRASGSRAPVRRTQAPSARRVAAAK